MKLKIATAAVSIAAALATTLCACSQDNTSSKLSVSQSYGIGAVSTVRLLGENLSASAVKTLAAGVKSTVDAAVSGETGATDATETAKSQADKFNEYFTALDSFLGEELVSTRVESNTDADYPFETKMTIDGRDLDGTPVSYTMYYTETLKSEKNKDGESESKYSLVGVLALDNADYPLEGGRETENEKDETETELKIRAYADANDRTSYIEMEHGYSVETDETETEYVYSVYSGGVLVEQTAVEFETERKGGATETEYELEFIKGEAKGKYKLEREVKDGSVEIKVKYNLGNGTATFKIREIDGENGKIYEYIFEDGTVVRY